MKKMPKLTYREDKERRISENSTTFVLEPLERGMANTLGQALRRTILSSVPSLAPFAVKIEGAEHEFQALENVEEDVVAILNNLKQVKFEYKEELFSNDTPIKVSFNGDSEDKVIRAKDIIVSAGTTKVSNPEQYIATVSKPGALKFELFLKAGRGFVSFEDNKKVILECAPELDSKIKNGQFLAIDSDFSPVLSVHHSVEELNSASQIVEEKLEFSVETDGTITPENAIKEASNILMALLSTVSNTDPLSFNAVDYFEEEIVREEQPKERQIDLSELELSVRSANALRRAGFKTVADIEKIDEEELFNVKNLGKKSVQEIIEKLKERKERKEEKKEGE
ncbi:DNA-directed RNA polymerase subunit alpha [Mycoplasma procyoni]|uniref:DNA-directed RNA polymerase subunit alpha n=1 Tax=Mycoplasma procyoni TaxID=568784 RepID=UPI00197B62FF|nr:DNA-directed RNA polymerase subunit alpha [Mycoplasma procyoni]MBN3534971.1 DNA-directed RNA polymerase subunit alpha [Mycoplasma procyoni]